MRFLQRSLTGLFLAALTLAFLSYGGYIVKSAVNARISREASVPKARERMFSVNVLRAEAQSVVPTMTVFGEVQSARQLDLRAATGGPIIELAPEFVEGGRVEMGQVLVRIDPATAQSAFERAQSDVLDAQAETRDAARAIILAKDEVEAAQDQAKLREKAYQRQLDLKQRGVGTEATVETAELAASSARQAVLARRQSLAQAEARIDQAATRLNRANIALAEAQRRLNDTVIKAEFSGTLSDVSVVKGRLVSNNEKLGSLIDGQALEVAFRVSTQQYARLLGASGKLKRLPVKATLDVYGVDLDANGILSRESAQVGAGQTGRLVFASLELARGLKPGDFVSVEIKEAALDAVIALPASALDASRNVLVVGPDDRLEVLGVTLLRRQGDGVLVRNADLIGRDVVSERSPLLGPGIKIKPLRPNATIAVDEPELIELSDERRAKLVAFVEANTRMPKEVKARILARLQEQKVPAQMIERIEARIGG